MKAEIFELIRTELVERYRRKDKSLRELGDGQMPGNWFGLQEVIRTTVYNSLLEFECSYQMDDDLCEVLEVSPGSICVTTERDGKVVQLHIYPFEHLPADLKRIKALLESAMTGFLLRA